MTDQIKKQGRGYPINNIEAMCVSESPFSDSIKLMVPRPKFSNSKCAPYKRMDDPVTNSFKKNHIFCSLSSKKMRRQLRVT